MSSVVLPGPKWGRDPVVGDRYAKLFLGAAGVLLLDARRRTHEDDPSE